MKRGRNVYPFIEKCHGASLELGLKDQGGELGVGRGGRGHPFSLNFVLFLKNSQKNESIYNIAGKWASGQVSRPPLSEFSGTATADP